MTGVGVDEDVNLESPEDLGEGVRCSDPTSSVFFMVLSGFSVMG